MIPPCIAVVSQKVLSAWQGYSHHPLNLLSPIERKPNQAPPNAIQRKLFFCHEPGCPQSSQPFTRGPDLHRHHREMHGRNRDGTSAKRYRCPAQPCDRKERQFKRKDALRNHLQQVHGRSDYALESCATTDERSQQKCNPVLPAVASPAFPQSDLVITEYSQATEYAQANMKELGDREVHVGDDGSDHDDEVCRDFIRKLNASSEKRKRILEESHLQLMKRLQEQDEEERYTKSALRHRREVIRMRTGEGQQYRS